MPAPRRTIRPALLLLATLAVLGCGRPTPPREVESESPAPGADGPNPAAAPHPALRRVAGDGRGPDLAAAFRHHDAALLEALRRSLAWFDRPESRAEFPRQNPPVTHDRARRSVATVLALLERCPDEASFRAEVLRRFELFESVGADGHGTVQFTAYFAPEYAASRRRTDRFRYPLYTRPTTGPGAPDADGRWPVRRAIETRQLLAGYELVWLEDRLDAYLVHVNGSARLRLADDGGIACVGHDGTNEHEYTSLGRLLIDAGLATPDTMSMQTIRALHRRQPETVERLMRENDRYVFFRELDAGQWPRGALGVPLTAGASVATDKSVFPPGGVLVVDTEMPNASGGRRPVVRFMLDQDAGGAIRGPGRADLYVGVGPAAGAIAGRQDAHGRLYYLFVAPDG